MSTGELFQGGSSAEPPRFRAAPGARVPGARPPAALPVALTKGLGSEAPHSPRRPPGPRDRVLDGHTQMTPFPPCSLQNLNNKGFPKPAQEGWCWPLT